MENAILPEQSNPEEIQTKYEHLEIWSNARRAKNVIIAFWLVFGVTLLAVASDYFEVMLLKDITEGRIPTEEVINNSDLRQRILAILQFIGIIITGILFLYWFRRAYGNMQRVRLHTEHSESMATWSFVIPIISLFRPPQMMYEVWNKTQIKIKQLDPDYVIQPNRFTIGIWWTLFIITHLIGRYIIKTAFDDHSTVDDIINASKANMVSDILQVIDAFFIIVILNNLSDIETKLADEVNRNGGDVVFFN